MPFFKLQLNGILSTLKRIGGILMIKNTFEEVLSDEWVKLDVQVFDDELAKST